MGLESSTMIYQNNAQLDREHVPSLIDTVSWSLQLYDDICYFREDGNERCLRDALEHFKRFQH